MYRTQPFHFKKGQARGPVPYDYDDYDDYDDCPRKYDYDDYDDYDDCDDCPRKRESGLLYDVSNQRAFCVVGRRKCR